MRILFVYPSSLDEFGNPIKYKYALLPPLSLAILSALTPAHHEIQVIDDRVQEIDYSVPYDVVATTATTFQIERAYQITEKFRNAKSKVIIGGVHATALPHEVKKHADAVVKGEAEDIWEIILSDCEKGRLEEFYKASTFPNLQKLVIPKWDNLNLDIYLKRKGIKLPTMPLFTTRGCIFNCRFCSATKFFGETYRFKPIAHVLKEIDATYGAQKYFFVDDNIVGNVDYSRELFTQLKRKNIRWLSQASTTILRNPYLIDLASESGCTELLLGIESINSNNLLGANKGFNKIEEYDELFKRLRKAGINPYVSIIFGFDDDTEETFPATLEFLSRNNINDAFFWILTPLPGADLFKEMQEEGRLLNENWSLHDLAHVVFKPKNFSPDELYKKFWDTYKKFFTTTNIFKTIWYNRSIYFRSFQQFMLMNLFRYYSQKKISMYEHPLSGGIERIN